MFGALGAIGIITTIVTVGGSLFFVVRLLSGLSRGERERQRLLAVGVPAKARILNVGMGGMSITTGAHRQIQVQLSLEVHRPGVALYGAMLSTLVSELQIPQVQPGSWLGVRVDPANPQAMAIEAMAVSPPDAVPAGVAAVGVMAAPPVFAAVAAAPAAGVAPLGGFVLPLAAKIGLAIGLVCAALGVLTAIVATSWTSGLGGPSDACKKAAACCKKAVGKNAAASSCDNLTHQSGPIADTVCEETLKSMRHSGVCK